MSWAGFKKGFNRAGTTLLQKTGQIERTVDREFLDEESRFKIFEKNGNALHKEAKTYLDSLRATTSAQVRIADTIDHFYSDSSDAAMSAHAYKRAVEEIDSNVSRELDAPYRATVLEPIGRLASYFPEVNNAIAKRNKKALDYDSARSKVKKFIDKPSDDPTKIQRAEKEADDAKEIFELLNGQLISELPQLLDVRVPYLDPSFEAMVRLQCRFADESYEKLANVQRHFPENVRDDYASGELDVRVENALQDLRTLSICGVA